MKFIKALFYKLSNLFKSEPKGSQVLQRFDDVDEFVEKANNKIAEIEAKENGLKADLEVVNQQSEEVTQNDTFKVKEAVEYLKENGSAPIEFADFKYEDDTSVLSEIEASITTEVASITSNPIDFTGIIVTNPVVEKGTKEYDLSQVHKVARRERSHLGRMNAIYISSADGFISDENGDLPFDAPEDLVFFKTLTEEHIVIMGRKTSDTLVKRFGVGYFSNRINIIVTSDPKSVEVAKDRENTVIVVDSFEKAVKTAKNIVANPGFYRAKYIFFIGGGEIFKQVFKAYPHLRVYRTVVEEALGNDFKGVNINPDLNNHSRKSLYKGNTTNGTPLRIDRLFYKKKGKHNERN